jgi:arginyl-tRNA synthetase
MTKHFHKLLAKYMPDMKSKLLDIIKDTTELLKHKWPLGKIPEVILEIPKVRVFGDISTNIAMQISKSARDIRPQEIAADIVKSLTDKVQESDIRFCISKIEVKPPGFINFYFSQAYLQSVVKKIINEGSDFGRSDYGRSKRVLIEFVSANPTGPLSVAHGRQAAIGDVLANILDFSGYKVEREYYLNDEGNQILILGQSIRARYYELLGESHVFPENGYRGDYIYDIAKFIIEKQGKNLILPDKDEIRFFCESGVKYIIDDIKKDLSDFKVKFDNFYSQGGLGRSGRVEKVLNSLKEKGFIYEKDSALWFASTRFGDDKDRVLRKSDGSYTYIMPDIAYHQDKFDRGFDILIDLWGPDHHGYIKRMKAACQAIGKDADSLSVLIIQLVSLSRGGIPVKMSTRAGEFISLREVMDEVGQDVTRFFFLTRRRDSHLEFDLELAKKESMENPVYYIQYAHARICGILEHGNKQGKGADRGKDEILELLNTKEELEILRLLWEFPDIIEYSAINKEPHKLISYLIELAGSFHSFYSKHRVVSEDKALASARLMLTEALKKVFSKSLILLGVSVPKRM